jgi:hypothetical protein
MQTRWRCANPFLLLLGLTWNSKNPATIVSRPENCPLAPPKSGTVRVPAFQPKQVVSHDKLRAKVLLPGAQIHHLERTIIFLALTGS